MRSVDDTGGLYKLLQFYDTVDEHHQSNVTPPMIPQRHLSHKLQRVFSALPHTYAMSQYFTIPQCATPVQCHNALQCFTVLYSASEGWPMNAICCTMCTAPMQYNIN